MRSAKASQVTDVHVKTLNQDEGKGSACINKCFLIIEHL